MNKYVHLDMALLHDVFDDTESLAAFLTSARETLELYLQNLEAFRAGGDRTSYQTELHRIKGSLGALGANECFNEAVTLEHHLKIPENTDWPDHTLFIGMVDHLVVEIRTQCAQF